MPQWVFYVLLFAMGVLSIVSQKAAYHNGFRDGAKWMDSPGYPSRPHAKWYGWKELNEILERRRGT